MEIREGYKQTELGVIPEDWIECTFEDIMTGFASGQTPYRAIERYYSGEIPWITSGELNYNVITDTLEKITKEAAINTNLKRIPVGTFLFAITGLEAEGTRGSCSITGIEATTNQSCMALYPKQGLLTTEYLFQFYLNYGNWLALRFCQGTKQQSYTGGIAKKLPIIIPPNIQEQTAIATVLSDTDALITSLEKLIEKKRAIKQGAMQELLKPKEGWMVKKLGEVLKVKHGKSQHEVIDENGNYPILASGGIIGKSNKYLYNKPSVLIGRKGTIDKPQFMTSPFWTVDTLFYTEIFDDYDAKFIFYLFNKIYWYDYNEASGVPSLNAKTIEAIEQSFPKSKNEQIRISNIISDLDTEISAMEQNLSKYELLKQGMMQNLLTGKIRLV
ncbi:MAG: restriction endonuclease subunit S [Bacteroidetes bacterium]|nr:restriction endonuclease subunit S [Bacteroidota bacterium]